MVRAIKMTHTPDAANNIKEIREKLGFTQIEMAKKVRVSQPTWAMYETGQRKPSIPASYRIVKVARAHGMNITLEYVRPE